jgi:hypothetical protein
MFISISNAIGSLVNFSTYVMSLIGSFKNRVYTDDGEFEAEACLISQLDQLESRDLLDTASLVVTPNAVKENKLFSIVPVSGAGDLDVVRATSATRVNSDGLIEQVPYNLLQRSEEFNNAIWTKLNAAITSNSVVAPNNSLTADTFTTSNVNATIDQNVTFQNPCTFSVYVKYIDSQFIQLYAGVSSQARANFDILNGVLGNRGTDTSTSTIENVGNGWYKLTVTFINNSGASNIRIKFVASLTSGWGTASTNAINSAYLWGAQFVTGTSAKEYFPTTDRLDVPRLDYTGGGCPAILTEPQRTNTSTYSEDFSNAVWSKVESTISSIFGTSPDGTVTADKFIPSTNASNHYIERAGVVTLGQSTISVFAKNSGYRYLVILTGVSNVSFDLTNGVVGTTSGVSTSKIENYGNGWYRCSMTITAVSSNFFISGGSSSNAAFFNQAGDGTSGILLWGAQTEVGAEDTSYIPTIAASATRNWDTISRTGISSLINSTEGSFYVEASSAVNGGSFRTFSLSDGTANNRLTIAWSSTADRLLAFMNLGGINVLNQDILSFNQTANNKILFVWGGGNFKVFINGVNKLSLTSVTMPSANLFNRFGFDLGTNSSNFYGRTKAAMIFQTALTDAQGELLTGSSFYTYDEMAIALNYNIQ